MKLIAGLIASTMAIDCPNSAWVANSDDTACVPAPGTVSVTCNPTDMVVTFNHEHLYVNVDSQHTNGASTSGASAGGCTEVLSDSSTGEYSLSISLDDCGTEVIQGASVISFTNTITGNDAALVVDGIITTEKLELDVQCDYDSSFDITVGDIGIVAAGHDLGDSESTGNFDTEFDLSSYVDSTYSQVSNATSTVVIGEKVYNRISVTGNLPSNVDYVVKQCTASDSDTNPTKSYDILKDGCLDNLVGTTEVTDLRGNDGDDVDFSFNGFTFESTSDTLFLECTIALCALDANGDFQGTCGFDDSDLATTCAADGAAKALGLSAASAVNV